MITFCPQIFWDLHTLEKIIDTEACDICRACIPGCKDPFELLEVVS